MEMIKKNWNLEELTQTVKDFVKYHTQDTILIQNKIIPMEEKKKLKERI